jgi:hypothetical protein
MSKDEPLFECCLQFERAALHAGRSANVTMYVNGTTTPNATMLVQWTVVQYSVVGR